MLNHSNLELRGQTVTFRQDMVEFLDTLVRKEPDAYFVVYMAEPELYEPCEWSIHKTSPRGRRTFVLRQNKRGSQVLIKELR